MYIIKNALRCIGRGKGRNILIGIIVLVIAVSACLGLSIRQAAVTAKEETLSTLSVTATISFDRQSAMQGMRPPSGGEGGDRGSFDKDSFAQMMGQSSSLTLEQYETYAAADSVSGFYYTLTASFNGGEGLDPVSNESVSDTDATDSDTSGSSGRPSGGFPGGMGGFGGFSQIMGSQSDFSVVGYSTQAAMTAFVDGTASIAQDENGASMGRVFAEGTDQMECIITQELATYNDVAVGDTILLANPNSEEETYTLTVVGIYTDSSANENSFSMMGSTSGDPANQIYMSAAALQKVLDASAEVSETVTDEDTGREFETKLNSTLSGTYVFATADDYYLFENEVRELGLEETYTVSSPDLTAFENSLAPLNTLSTTAGTFLTVILIIGGIILVVLNIFNVRERKYEIGVLTAMGMKKGKVAAQFMTEIFVITLVAVVLGVVLGGVSAVPVTNALLEGQSTSSQAQSDRIDAAFGEGGFGGGDFSGFGGGGFGGMPGGGMPGGDRPSGGFGGDMFADIFGQGAADYITEIDSAMNLTVVWQMLGIAILLTLLSGAVSMLFIMRYEPLRILSNRD
ncbi:MAG: ABC transporter permease [Clostridia bacterium]|nr:ABC transporter permease [Clostridia bacterium]